MLAFWVFIQVTSDCIEKIGRLIDDSVRSNGDTFFSRVFDFKLMRIRVRCEFADASAANDCSMAVRDKHASSGLDDRTRNYWTRF